MTSETASPEQDVIEDLRRTFEAQGLPFYSNPGEDIIPDFLRGYHPDGIVLYKDGGGIIFEIKNRRSDQADRQLAQIAQRVARHKGWEFRAVFINPEIPVVIPKPTPEQINGKIKELEALLDSKHYGSALVTGWAIIESLARLVMDDDRAPSKPLSPIQAVQILAQEGYLENQVAQRLREGAKLRNAAVHGDFSVEIQIGPVETILEQIKAISSVIAKTTKDQPEAQ
jgi:uncharacterized protein YutE (UPF0331/DUF86 family)